MFIQHKQLKSLNVPAVKIAHLHSSPSNVQLALTGYPPQLCQAHLLKVLGGNKVLIVVAFYLTESQSSVFFVPKVGELPVNEANAVHEEGYSFVESMGFALAETDYHLLSELKKQSYWTSLPISKPPEKIDLLKKKTMAVKSDEETKKLRLRSLHSLGRFFASM